MDDASSVRTLYHGTNRIFPWFSIDKAGRRDSGNLGRGVYLSSSMNIAKAYAEDHAKWWGGYPVVLVVRADLRKTAIFDDALVELLREDLGISFPPEARDEGRSLALTRWFLSRGYDSLQVTSEVVVFDSSRLSIQGAFFPHLEEMLGTEVAVDASNAAYALLVYLGVW